MLPRMSAAAAPKAGPSVRAKHRALLVLTALALGFGALHIREAGAQSRGIPTESTTIVGAMQAPHLQYGLAATVRERDAGRDPVTGTLVISWFDAGFDAVTDIRRGRLFRSSAGDVVGAGFDGRSDINSEDGSIQKQVRTYVRVSADSLDIELRFRDGTIVRDTVPNGIGGNRFESNVSAALLVMGVGAGTDRAGDTVQLSLGIASLADGTAIGTASAAIFHPTAPRVSSVVATINEASVLLSRQRELQVLELQGGALVDHEGQTCVGGVAVRVDQELQRTVLAIPDCGVQGESQANRRYLYFAKVAD